MACLTVCSSRSPLIGNSFSLGSGSFCDTTVFSSDVISRFAEYTLYAGDPVTDDPPAKYVPAPAL